MSIGIYKITSPSNKVYVGQSINMESRKSQYRRLKCKRQPKIYNSLKKYGWEQHKFEIIEKCSVELLDEREIFWKHHYMSRVDHNWEMVLFCELKDAHTGGERSEDTKKKMSESHRGKKHSEETKIKIGKAHKGKITSPETKDKMKKSQIGKHNIKKSQETKAKIEKAMTLKRGKPVVCYNLDGTKHRIFSSLNKASREMGVSLSSITLCCQGKKYKSVGGYIWRYKI